MTTSPANPAASFFKQQFIDVNKLSDSLFARQDADAPNETAP